MTTDPTARFQIAGTVLNPEAIGNPDQTPILQMSPDLEAILQPCNQPAVNGYRCGGVNGFHQDVCPHAVPGRTFTRPATWDGETA